MAAQEIENIFADILKRVKALDPANARKWFDELAILRLDGGLLGIGCPDEATIQFLRDNCKSSFIRAAQQITGHLVTVDFQLNSHEESAPTSRDLQVGLKLHPDYTFDNFVVGPSNRLAHASCIAVSSTIGKAGSTYNPLFLYGNSGLGKTHLLHAVCCEAQHTSVLSGTAKGQSNGIVIQLLSCEDFVNRFIKAIEEGNLSGFQSQFRTADALIIDDIQFLRRREQSQEEFFHTFNVLYADSPPSEIPSLEARLISRFNWGLVARIDPPSFETRAAIVQKKAHLRGLNISDEIAEYIAGKVQTNIRELEGALTTIYALAITTGEEISMNLARSALDEQIGLETKHINISDIIEVVTKHFDVRLTDLQSKRRSQSITEPRQICMYLTRNLTKHSLEEIGGHLGGRDHTTVMHAYSKIEQAKKSDPKMHALLEELARQVGSRQVS